MKRLKKKKDVKETDRYITEMQGAIKKSKIKNQNVPSDPLSPPQFKSKYEREKKNAKKKKLT